MKEVQVILKLKKMAEQGGLSRLASLALYDKVVYYAGKNKLTVAEYIEMRTGEKYVPKRHRTSPLAKIYPPHELYRMLEYKSVQELADESGFTKQGIYKLIDRYREAGVWGAGEENQETP